MENKQYTPEQLIKMLEELEEPVKVETPSEKTPVSEISLAQNNTKFDRKIKRFILEKKIVPGEFKVPVYKLMYEYSQWNMHETSFREVPSAKTVGRIFGQYFKKHRSGLYRYYYVNEFCDLSKAALKISKEYYQKYILSKRKNAKIKKISKFKKAIQKINVPTSSGKDV